MEETLKKIAKELDGLDITDATKTESNIANLLIKTGYLIVEDNSAEIGADWFVYVVVAN